jgi:hypothetical protein
MAVGSGLGSQVGIAEETVWGSAVPVTRFFPIDGSNVKPMKKSVQGQGLQAGTYVHQGSLRADTSTWVQGDMTMDFTSKQMGLLFKHALGSASIVQNGTTAAWTQTWGLGNNVNGLGLTLQGGLPQANGTVVPYTYSGCKIDQWDISCAAQDIVKSKFTFGGQATATATALATPSYPTANNIFYFKQGTSPCPVATTWTWAGFSSATTGNSPNPSETTLSTSKLLGLSTLSTRLFRRRSLLTQNCPSVLCSVDCRTRSPSRRRSSPAHPTTMSRSPSPSTGSESTVTSPRLPALAC